VQGSPPIIVLQGQRDAARNVELNLLDVILGHSNAHLSCKLLGVDKRNISLAILGFKHGNDLSVFGSDSIVEWGLTSVVILHPSIVELQELDGLDLILSYSEMKGSPLIVVL
jgi:hypothetical protein